MFYVSIDYGKTWIFVKDINWWSPEYERLKTAYLQGGYATKYEWPVTASYEH